MSIIKRKFNSDTWVDAIVHMGRRLVLLVLALTSAALARVDPGRLGCARRAATRPPRAASRLLARVKKAKASTTPDTDEVRSAQAEADGDNPFSLKGAVPAGADAGVVDGAPPRLFAVFGRDHDSLEDVRFALHNEHVEYLRSIKNGVYEAGYFLHPHLQSAAGTLYLIDAASADEARAVAAADPLSTAGLFSELHVHEWARLMEAALDNYLTSPPFLVYCADKAGGEALRQATRPAHLDWLRASAERISFVGPLLAEPAPAAGGASAPSAVGSLMLVCGPSLEEVQAWAATDPYKQAGLFERSTVLPFTSLDVVDRALPNCPAPPLAEWWTDEEKANAPPLLVPTAQIDETQGCFTEDGALRSAAQEIRDAEAEEDSAEVERWAEAMERSRLGAARRAFPHPAGRPFPGVAGWPGARAALALLPALAAARPPCAVAPRSRTSPAPPPKHGASPARPSPPDTAPPLPGPHPQHGASPAHPHPIPGRHGRPHRQHARRRVRRRGRPGAGRPLLARLGCRLRHVRLALRRRARGRRGAQRGERARARRGRG